MALPNFNGTAFYSSMSNITWCHIFFSILPIFPFSRVLFTLRIWSSRIRADLLLNGASGLQPNGCPLLVIGATSTRGKMLFISSGEMIRHGLVFWISEPRVGSSSTQKTSQRLTTPTHPLRLAEKHSPPRHLYPYHPYSFQTTRLWALYRLA